LLLNNSDITMPTDDEQPREESLAGEEVPANDEVEQKRDASQGFDDAAEEDAREKLRREREARAQALTLEIVGDLPYAEVKPPENVLFVCKLNPVTEGQTSKSTISTGPVLTANLPQMMTWTPYSAVSVL